MKRPASGSDALSAIHLESGWIVHCCQALDLPIIISPQGFPPRGATSPQFARSMKVTHAGRHTAETRRGRRPCRCGSSRHFDKAPRRSLLEAANIDILHLSRRSTIFSTCSAVIVFFFDQSRCDRNDAFGSIRSSIYQRSVRPRWSTVGNAMEDSEAENGRFWCPTKFESKILGHAGRHGCSRSITSGASVPPNARIRSRVFVISFPQMRWMAWRSGIVRTARSSTLTCHWSGFGPSGTPDELALIREASDRVVEAMLATFAPLPSGQQRSADVTARLRQEELNRGLNLTTA